METKETFQQLLLQKDAELSLLKKEVQLEAALEKVRARTMAMQTSQELKEVVLVLYKQLDILGLADWGCEIMIFDKEANRIENWVGESTNSDLNRYYVEGQGHMVYKKLWKNWEKQTPIFTLHHTDEVKREFDNYWLNHTDYKTLPDEVKATVLNNREVFLTYAFVKHGALTTAGYRKLNNLETSILERFAKVFEQTYTRFLDLQKAEEQARESEIQLALERVRSRSMAMHKSEELSEVVFELFSQMFPLGLARWGFGIWLINDTESQYLVYFSTPTDRVLPEPYLVTDMGFHLVEKITRAYKEQSSQCIIEYRDNEKRDFDDWCFEKTGMSKFPESVKQSIYAQRYVQFTFCPMKFGLLQAIDVESFPEKHISILQRFTKVFEQTYTRFLDLQKAEAQAREAEIELAIERVRARSMAMYRSEELTDVVTLLFEEIKPFGFASSGLELILPDERNDILQFWTTSTAQNKFAESFNIARTIHPFFQKTWKAWKDQLPRLTLTLEGEEKKKFDRLILTATDFKRLPEEIKQFILNTGYRDVFSSAIMKHGLLESVDIEPISEEQFVILERFAKVFEQTYTRFLDLQKAEAQAREAEIQLALERIRARTMAMQKSDELAEAGSVLFKQMSAVGIEAEACWITLINSKEDSMTLWISYDGLLREPNKVFGKDHPNFRAEIDAWKSGQELVTITMAYDEFVKTNKDIFNSDVKTKPADSLVYIQQFLHRFGFLGLSGLKELNEDEKAIFQRFTQVFEQTYTRFLDLQKAEAQAREAQIEAALERVRSRTMGMQHSEELQEAANLLFEQIELLGVNAFGTGFNIWDEDRKAATAWMAGKDRKQAPFKTSSSEDIYVRIHEGAEKGKSLFVEEQTGDELKAHYEYLMTIPVFKEVATKMAEQGIGLPKYQIMHCAYFSKGYLMFITHEPALESQAIFIRFAKVFEQTYTRFLDLQKAEAQARESRINLAVERVRAEALAMHKSEEIMKVVAKLKDEVMALDIPDVIAATIFLNEGQDKVRMWDLSSVEKVNDGYQLPFDITFELKEKDPDLYVKRVWENPENYFLEIQDEKDFKRYVVWLRENNKVEVAGKIEEYIEATNLKRLHHVVKKLNNGKLAIDLLNPPSDEIEVILTKMGAAFDLAYKRFEDLRNSESQARESQIQLSLERVRARTMAMQNSDELGETSAVLDSQVRSLGINTWGCAFNIYGENESTEWFSSEAGSFSAYVVPRENIFLDYYEAGKNGETLLVKEYAGEKCTAHYEYLCAIPVVGDSLNALKAAGGSFPTFQIDHVAYFKYGYLLFITFEPMPEAYDIFKRFANVFEQTYTRFLDLQKAEAQARDSQIEAALERVRAQTMAMHSSEDVGKCIVEMFGELTALGVDEGTRFGIGILNHDNENNQLWTASKDGEEFKMHIGNLDMTLHPLLKSARKAWKEQIPLHKYVLEGEDLLNYYQMLNDASDYPLQIALDKLPEREFHYGFVFQHGFFYAFCPREFQSDLIHITQRFSSQFEQTYTRYLDLEKAEAQAREAQIEAGLERIRSRTMAIQKTDELLVVGEMLYKELAKLGISCMSGGFALIEENADRDWSYMVSPEDGTIYPAPIGIPRDETKIMSAMTKSWKNKELYHVQELTPEETIIHQTYIAENTINFGFTAAELISFSPERLVIQTFNFKNGYLMMIGGEKLSVDQISIMVRFTKVFEQTYTRFLDLQKAEEQAREAIKQASLDRVRGEIASMRSTVDLNRITPLIWNELTTLGVPFIRCGVFIVNEAKENVEVFLSTPDGKPLGMLNLSFDSSELTANTIKAWRKGEVYRQHWNKEEFVSWTSSLLEHGQIGNSQEYQGTIEPPEKLDLHFIPFKQGMLYVGSTQALEEETIDLVQSLADAFSIAYARYEDFNELEKAKQSIETTLSELKATQKQLIQSEKMASLGELTAGIAHEIQNPLNFVNNFSEVTEELVEELEEEGNKENGERDKGLEKELISDIKDNLKKIHHHGNRASSIVKGMLEHSRTSSGKKELTDINALADEYLRLSYHGLRAKNKDFNAEMVTNFDPELPKIEVIPQDIGRVFLNLINNAFQACIERSSDASTEPGRSAIKNQGEKFYKPLVSVATQLITNNQLQISITDNGPGIPDSIKDKIFQPFFTTKDTGKGTGLGLSLAYDIVKGHGGELSLDSERPGETAFIIQLPLKNQL